MGRRVVSRKKRMRIPKVTIIIVDLWGSLSKKYRIRIKPVIIIRVLIRIHKPQILSKKMSKWITTI